VDDEILNEKKHQQHKLDHTQKTKKHQFNKENKIISTLFTRELFANNSSV
jgi:hypothetical protein